MVLLKSGGPSHRQRLEEPVGRSVEWLLAMQNADGGWPPLCRGAGRTPADRSAIDITARVLRTLDVWRNWFPQLAIAEAIRVGLDYLAKQQRGDGSWLPQGIVNPQSAGEANPLYGTAAVLLAYRDLGLLEGEPAHRGLSWLAAHAGFEEPAPAATTVPAAAAARRGGDGPGPGSPVGRPRRQAPASADPGGRAMADRGRVGRPAPRGLAVVSVAGQSML